jgi:acetylornithine deacetylase
VRDADVARVVEQVDINEIVGLASDLVRIPSWKGEETECARFLVSYMKDHGFEAALQEVEPGRFNAICRLPGRDGGRSLMLNGHIDIDPLARDWRHDPWMPVVEGDRLYGSGVANMKAGVATMIGAADAVRRSGVRLAGDIVIAGVVGELQGGVGSKFIAEHGPRADAAIVAEPFGAHSIVTVHAGWLQAALHVLGKSEHVSKKEHGLDAIEMATKAIAALRDIEFSGAPREDLPGLPRMIVGSIIGGQGRDYDLKGPNFVSDFVTMILDVRFVHSQTAESVIADIRRTLDGVKRIDPRFEYELEAPAPPKYNVSYVVMPPFELPAGEYILDAVAGAYRRVTGRDPAHSGGPLLPTGEGVLGSSYGGDDTCHLMQAGIPCVLYGPGGYLDYPAAPDQYASISEMQLAAKVIAVTALDVSGGGA